ncbi:SRPBCC family protein [Kibdelosporangium philippinense]
MGIVYSSVLDAPLQQVFDWHARPGALVRLSPPWQPVHVVQESDSLRDGTAILGMPGGVRWIAQHQAAGYHPPDVFVDHLEGPLSRVTYWRHRHEFTAEGPLRTRLTDRVETPVPKAVLRPMFDYRHQQLAADLAVHAAYSKTPLTVAVTGSESAIGTAFTALLSTGGHRVVRSLDGVDGVVDLAGSSIELARRAASAGARVFVNTSRYREDTPGIRMVWVRPSSLSRDHLCDFYLRALVDDRLSGPVNAVLPETTVVRPRGNLLKSIVDRLTSR